MNLDTQDPAIHVDRAHAALEATIGGSVPERAGVLTVLQHLANAMRAYFGSALIAPVDNAAVDAAQAAAIAAPLVERQPMTAEQIAALGAPLPDRATLEREAVPEDPNAPRCAQCYNVGTHPIHNDRSDANRHDFIPPAAA